MFDDVVVVFVVVAIVVQLPLFFSMLTPFVPMLGCRCSPLLLGVVHLVDVLVRLDQVDAQLPQRSSCGITIGGFGSGSDSTPGYRRHRDEMASRVGARARRVVEAHDRRRQHVRLVPHPPHADHR